MELFDKDGNAIDLNSVASEAGFKTQADIDGAVGSAVERAKRTTAEKIRSELEAEFNDKLNNLQSKAKESNTEQKSELMAAMEAKMAQLEQQNKELAEQRKADIREAKRARLESKLSQAISGKFVDDETVVSLVNTKFLKTDENDDYYFVDSQGAATDLDGLIRHLMQTKPGLVKSSAVPGVGGKDAPGSIKKEYNSVAELGKDYDLFASQGRLDEFERLKLDIIKKKVNNVAPNNGVATLNFG